MSTLNGTDANGTWQLFIQDDVSADSGSVGSWSLTITPDPVPTVSLSSAAATTTNAPFSVTANFSESVNNFIASDISVTNGTVSGFSGSGSTYTFTVTPTSQGTVTVNVPAGVANDAGNNINTAATALTRTFDNIAPTVTLSSASATTTNAPFSVTANFSESVNNFIASDISVTNGTVSGFSGSGSTYTFTVTPTNQGTVTVNVPTGVANDAGNNINTAATALTRTFDNIAPTVTLSSASATTTNAPFSVTANFSESVNNFIASDISVTNGTVSGFSGSGSTYTFTVTPTSQGTVTVNVPAGVANDAGNNINTAATALTRTFDNIAPTVTLSSASATTTNAPFSVTANFSESVNNFIASDISVTNGTVSGFSGSGSTYTFTVTPTSQGTVTVNVPAGVANDAGNNNNTAATALSRTYDTIAPTVTINQAGGQTDPAPTSPINYTVTFSETVTGFDTSDITRGAPQAQPLPPSPAAAPPIM
ncbi:Ig-like domain-containing protein [[Phormidium] sp. ETS-05]|uniref:beta strand repeat-containing protein n=1 Tax=[Phormidium] sp. ETS-05 TaxID=222819 RepID=UPI0018EEFED2|nr:Ig-like domain-containing protein [[Phormidium] sp. ETS-05]